MFWIFYAVPALLLTIPYIQQKAAGIASTELSRKLRVPVQVGTVQFSWLNNLVLKDLYLEDLSGNVLFEASHVAAGFDVLPLLHGKIVFSSVRLFGFDLHLTKKTPDAPLNLQFVIDAFASKDTVKKEKKNIDLRFNSILIRRGNVTYNVLSQKATPGKFNPNHVDIRNLSANLSLKAFTNDSVNAYIKKMSFDEQSGFRLEKLSLNAVANRDSAFINDFEIRLPRTDLRLQQAHIDFTKVDSIAQIVDKAPVKLAIAPSSICLKDLQAFVPAFKNFSDTIELSAQATGYIDNINLQRLTLRYSDKMLFNGKMELKGITHPEETYLFGQVNKMYITTEGLEGILNNFNDKSKKLPDELERLGTIHFTGEISGFFDNLVAFGTFTSSIGSLKTDLIFGHDKEKNIAAYIKGHLATPGLELDKLFSGNTPVGKTAFKIALDAQRPVNGSFSGKVDARIQELELLKYKYENIRLSGKFRKNSFDGMLDINDPNGKVSMQGIFNHQGKNSVFNFTARAEHVKLDTLNLTKKYDSPDLSFTLNADFTGNNIDNLEGSILLDSFSFKTAPRDFFLKQLKVEAAGHTADRHLTVTSDIINGEVTGAYSFQTIVPSLLNTFKNYLPALAESKETKKKNGVKENNFSLVFTVENTEAASEAFKLPFTVINQARLVGHYNNVYDKFRFEAFLPMFKAGKTSFESGYVVCDNPGDQVNMEVRAINFNAKGLRNYIDIKADAHSDSLCTKLTWANNKERLFKADLAAITTFTVRQEEKTPLYLSTEIALEASEATFNDSTWTIRPARVLLEKGKVHIDDFYASHNEQFVKLDGTVSKEPSDTLFLELKELELSYIFDILNIPVLQFGGRATGTFNLTDLSGSRIVNTDLSILDFSFNQVVFGKLNLYSEWDDAQKGILMLGSIYKNDSTWTDINGYIRPIGPDAGLSLYFDANDLNVAFIQPFMANIASNLQGRGFGQVHLFGPFKALNLQGDVFVKDGGLGIDYLNTYYTFSDSVHLTPTSFYMRDITIYDKDGNRAIVNGTVNHTHFKNMTFQTNIAATDMLVYNATEAQNPLIYGQVYASGTTSIKGNGRLIDFNINLRNSPNTAITLNFMDGSKASEYDFITFVDREQPVAEKTDSIAAPKPEEENQGAELRMNFQLDMTPDATITLMIDPSSGDKIRGNGSGSLQIQYGNRSDLRIYGNYTIVDGVYNFSLQKVIHKNFKIREGSSVSFHGDPFSASMDIDAIYNLTANLTDLDESLMTESSRTNVPVNCILKLDGVIRNPAISFDIELPNSSPEIERQVKSIINTEDMMTRQIVYLLVLNKFYTPEYANISGGTSNFAAVASSTISSQLSNILSSITDKVQIGTNIRTNNTSFSDTEVELLLSSQLLNNRLLFNGNFGYKDSQQLNASFVGEFDLEYKLNKSGEIRLKAYNHYNDLHRYYDKSVPTTQGVGILFKKDFIRLSDIFKKKKPRYNLPPARSDSVPEAQKQPVR